VAVVTIDIRTKIIPDNLEIWRVFPGEEYSFFSDFLEHSAVFLDFPGIDLPVGALNFDAKSLAERILLSKANSEWAPKSIKPVEYKKDIPTEPSRNHVDYRNKPHPKSMRIAIGSLAGLFGRAKKGDLVVVPGRLTSRTIRIGELLDGPEDRIRLSVPKYGSEFLPGRRVRWFPPVNELEVAARVSEIIRKPNPFVAFDRTMYEDVFDHSYGTFQYKGKYSARFDTHSARFSGTDNLDFMILSESVAKIIEIIENDGIDNPYNSLIALADAHRSDLYKMDLSVNINSPGSISLKSLSIAPLVFVAMMTLANTTSAEDAPSKPKVAVVNSLSRGAADPCTPVVDERVRATLELMQFEVWQAACRKSERLRAGPQISSSGKVVPVPPATAAPAR
jgi:hypothetical protein